jgi:two-component system, chemotaxis family, CheB/CheR fusion protein
MKKKNSGKKSGEGKQKKTHAVKSSLSRGVKTVGNKPKRKQSEVSATAKTRDGRSTSFPVVGIGASAGGIEAFSLMLQNLPDNLDMAFVYVQHLSPDHESFLTEILSRKTKMKVLKAEHGMSLAKNNVFVIPANCVISLNDRVFKLEERMKKELFHPIDHFFYSLANNYKERAIGIILSGTATDGTLGLKAIKAEGGLTFAQDDTAKHLGMPHYAAEMGFADFVMSPDKIANELAGIIHHPYSGLRSTNEQLQEDKTELQKIHKILHARRNVDFSFYKQTTIYRRLMRRIILNRLKNLAAYTKFLKDNPAEVDALYQDFLITVTDFFREPAMYHALTQNLLPQMMSSRLPDNPLRIWIPGCATGEEAVSVAICILEYLGDKAFNTPVQIFATDLNEKAVERARTGIYIKNALQNMSAARLKKFFIPLEGHYQVVKSIREMIVYAPHNLLKDPPFSRMDIISCQNVLIYLEAHAQNKIMNAFHYALKPTGYLLLGRSETIGAATNLFEVVNKENKIYSKKNIATPLHLDFRIKAYSQSTYASEEEQKQNETGRQLDIERETERLLLKHYVPASVLVNKDLEILRFRGAVSKYLSLASGKASLHLMKMIKEEIAYDLRTIINQVKKEGRTVKKDHLHLSTNGDSTEISIEVVPVNGAGKDYFLLIIFQQNDIQSKAAEPSKFASKTREAKDRQIISLEKQLTESRENLKVMSEESEATREELQSANEEILSSNEELQSINEELETSKEELQSANEELTTINDELQNRNFELQEANEYAEGIIETMHEPLLILNADLRVRKASKEFYRFFRLSPEKLEGEYLFNLNQQEWNIPELRQQLKLLQAKNIDFTNFRLHHAFSDIGEKILSINGQKILIKEKNPLILLAIADITEQARAEQILKESAERFRLLIEYAFDILSIISRNGVIMYESDSITPILGYSKEERIGKNIFIDPIVHPDDLLVKKQAFEKALATPNEPVKTEFRLRNKRGDYCDIEAVYRNLVNHPRIEGIVATYHDITERKAMEKQREEFVILASHELKTPVTSMKGYVQILKDMFSQTSDHISEEFMQKLDHQIDRVSNLIKDLLDITLIREGKFELKKTRFDIDKCITESVNEAQLATKKHLLVADLKANVEIQADRERLEQVLTNLLSNAIKYSPGSDKIIVTSRLKRENITVSVQDYGIGIERETQKKIFEKFFRYTEGDGKNYPGLGLGLYISAEIIKQHGGKIELESEKNKGSLFSFSIPYKK